MRLSPSKVMSIFSRISAGSLSNGEVVVFLRDLSLSATETEEGNRCRITLLRHQHSVSWSQSALWRVRHAVLLEHRITSRLIYVQSLYTLLWHFSSHSYWRDAVMSILESQRTCPSVQHRICCIEVRCKEFSRTEEIYDLV